MNDEYGKAKRRLRKRALRLLLRIAVIAALCWLLFGELFLVSRMRGMEMSPALKDGDLLISYRMEKSWRRGDVAVYDAEGKRRVGRVAATAGDEVRIDTEGALYVNGSLQSLETWVMDEDGEPLDFVTGVPEGCVYVLGDDRPNSHDSRDYGAIAQENLKGKLITLVRRRGL